MGLRRKLPCLSTSFLLLAGESRGQGGELTRRADSRRGPASRLQGRDSRDVLERLTEDLVVVGRVQRRVSHDPKLQRSAIDVDECTCREQRELHVVREVVNRRVVAL